MLSRHVIRKIPAVVGARQSHVAFTNAHRRFIAANQRKLDAHAEYVGLMAKVTTYEHDAITRAPGFIAEQTAASVGQASHRYINALTAKYNKAAKGADVDAAEFKEAVSHLRKLHLVIWPSQPLT
jgi:hypothetical protein